MRDMEDLKLRANAAIEKVNRAQERIARCNQEPSAGDVYVFAETAALGIEWVAVLRNVDDPSIWFCLPMDMNPMVGTDDVPVPESSDAGSATIRCGRGLWMHQYFLATSGARSGFLESRYVDKARAIMSAMVTGQCYSIKVRSDVDFDPDYEEWIQDVTVAACRLEQSEAGFVRKTG